jgi:hypothetical protein
LEEFALPFICRVSGCRDYGKDFEEMAELESHIRSDAYKLWGMQVLMSSYTRSNKCTGRKPEAGYRRGERDTRVGDLKVPKERNDPEDLKKEGAGTLAGAEELETQNAN